MSETSPRRPAPPTTAATRRRPSIKIGGDVAAVDPRQPFARRRIELAFVLAAPLTTVLKRNIHVRIARITQVTSSVIAGEPRGDRTYGKVVLDLGLLEGASLQTGVDALAKQIEVCISEAIRAFKGETNPGPLLVEWEYARVEDYRSGVDIPNKHEIISSEVQGNNVGSQEVPDEGDDEFPPAILQHASRDILVPPIPTELLDKVTTWISRSVLRPSTEARVRSKTGTLAQLSVRAAQIAAMGQEMDHLVDRARDQGAAWREIGASVGITPQSAHGRWHSPSDKGNS